MNSTTTDTIPAGFTFCPACERARSVAPGSEICPDCEEWLDAAVALKVEEDRAATYADDEAMVFAAGIHPGKF